MTWLMRALAAVAVVLMFAVPATAQVGGRPLEISGGAGLLKYDVRARVKRGPAYVGSVGWRAVPWLTLEGNATMGPSKADTFPNQRHNYTFFSADLRWNLRSPDSKVIPFVLTGMGYGLSRTQGHPPDKLERGSPDLGLGVLFNVVNPRTYVRLQVRDHLLREREAFEFSNHFAASASVHFELLGKYRDQDLDAVRNWIDHCPDTPIGCKVDANGCPKDSDGDGVCDGVDQCPDTPRGCKVDKNGCPLDPDGDGVCDGLDQCADTPKGCTVDANGCPKDSDGDGVCDGVDPCADTPKGCTVNAEGCTTDGDGDGVCDALDACPNTPAGVPVGPSGCPAEIEGYERALLDSGLVRVKRVVFGREKSAIDSSAVLDSLGRVLQQYPGLRIEIGGPTDVRGKLAENERLSLEQAAAVMDYIKSRFPLINAAQFTLRGYAVPAEGLPEVPRAERLRGRRVEFKVLNADQLEAEREKRGLPKRGQ
jgi:OOP family OmpA-OmpF porin